MCCGVNVYGRDGVLCVGYSARVYEKDGGGDVGRKLGEGEVHGWSSARVCERKGGFECVWVEGQMGRGSDG